MARRKGPGVSDRAATMALTTGTVDSPSVSPWKEHSSHLLPASPPAGGTTYAQRSPWASVMPVASFILASTALVTSSAAGPSKLLLDTRIRLFWSRLWSRAAGFRTWNSAARVGVEAMVSAKTAEHSCRNTISHSTYCVSRMLIVSATLLVESVLHRDILTPCHVVGPTALSMCTRMASKMAQQSVCSGTLIASSLSVRAGYFARGIVSSMLHGLAFLDPPPLAGTSSSRENIHDFQASHQVAMSGKGGS
mmetsp:Transcript_102006/g.277277  ORF Transcript_102006/g.277277 Transcript_102006/m.277277 type:complete len:250 (+) Transcript_102006:526-1275(+)